MNNKPLKKEKIGRIIDLVGQHPVGIRYGVKGNVIKVDDVLSAKKLAIELCNKRWKDGIIDAQSKERFIELIDEAFNIEKNGDK